MEICMDLSNYADNILNIYNYSEGIIIVNREGVIEYFKDRTLGNSRLHEKMFSERVSLMCTKILLLKLARLWRL